MIFFPNKHEEEAEYLFLVLSGCVNELHQSGQSSLCVAWGAKPGVKKAHYVPAAAQKA